MSIDLVGSTPLADALDPERFRDIVIGYHDICSEAIARFDGRVSTRAGDGLMVHFGINNPHEDDARRAVLTGLEIVTAMREFARDVSEVDHAEVNVRIGIHTGPVVITEIAGRTDIVGTTPNETARIESSATPGTISISAATHALVKTDFDFQPPRIVELRGVSAPMTTYTVIGLATKTTRPRTVLPFVGRRKERDALDSLWDRVLEQSPTGPRAALIVGEPGFGKSRLADHFARDVRDDASVLVLETREYNSVVPFHPFAAAITNVYELAQIESHDDRHLALTTHLNTLGIASLTPLLTQVLRYGHGPLGEAEAFDPSVLHAAIVEALVTWLTAMAADHPLLVIAEDLHWADPSSLTVLKRLIESSVPNLAVVATCRPTFTSPFPTEQVDTLTLPVLSDDDIAQLVRLVDAGSPLTDEQSQKLSEHSDGVPLYIDRFIHVARHNPAFWRTQTPTGLDQLVTTILEGPGVDYQLVGQLATLGRTFELSLAAKTVGLAEADLTARLNLLCEQGILECAERSDPPSYVFHHALFQTVAYEHLLPSDRRAAHSRAAQALQHRTAATQGEAVAIARHFDEAAHPDEAIPRYLQASEWAQRSGAVTEATGLVERAIELLDTLPADQTRDALEADLQLHYSLCLSSLQGYASTAAATASQRALDLSAHLASNRQRLRILTDLVSYYTIRGDRVAAQATLDRIRPLARTFPRSAVVHDQLLALQLYIKGWVRESYELYLTVVDRLEELDRKHESELLDLPADSLSAAYAQLGVLGWFLGDVESARSWMARALKRAQGVEGAKGAFSEAYVRAWLWSLEMKADTPTQALATATENAQQCSRRGLAMWGGFASVHQSISAALVAPDAASAGVVEMVIGLLNNMGALSLTPYFTAEHARVKIACGDMEGAVQTLDDALARSTQLQEFFERPEMLRLRAAARRSLAPDADVTGELSEAANLAIEQGSTIYAIRSLVDLIQVVEPGRRAELCAALLTQLSLVATPDDYPEIDAARRVLTDLSLDET